MKKESLFNIYGSGLLAQVDSTGCRIRSYPLVLIFDAISRPERNRDNTISAFMDVNVANEIVERSDLHSNSYFYS